jgi:predicted RNase H-like HicB family nuclease
MKIISQEKWTDGSPVEWEVAVREVPMDDYLDEWYGRDVQTNRELIALGGEVRAFVVESVLVEPDLKRSEDEEEPIAGTEFGGVAVGDRLVVLMNYKEVVEKQYGQPAPEDFNTWPTLLNLQDCGFDVEVVEMLDCDACGDSVDEDETEVSEAGMVVCPSCKAKELAHEKLYANPVIASVMDQIGAEPINTNHQKVQ